MKPRTARWALSLGLALTVGCPVQEALDASTSDAPPGDVGPPCTSSEACDDGLFCNGVEQCTGGRCVSGAAPSCSDGIACTRDFCSEEMGACRNNPVDGDGDGAFAASCLDARGAPLGTDCDDADALRYAGALEVCDVGNRDEDCDAATLGGVDSDADGFVDARCCNGATCGDDCNDAVRGASPMGTEVCNRIDDDCDGRVDEGVLQDVYLDLDGDGRGGLTSTLEMRCASDAGYSVHHDDCNDASLVQAPGIPEVCDGIDNDCNGMVDDNALAAPWYPDGDGDGFGAGTPVISCAPPGVAYSLLGTDCNDSVGGVNPRAAEVCNGRDDDCRGGPNFVIAEGNTEDDDADGVPDAACMLSARDCDDRDAASGPGGEELCDGRDNDCDTRIDESVTRQVFFRDADGDGYGATSDVVESGCFPPAGTVARGGDCDDMNPARRPFAMEQCNGMRADDDCDGAIDESADLACALPNTIRGCVAGSCALLECAAGYFDCDMNPANGCDASESIIGNPRRCGCTACTGSQICAADVCVSSTAFQVASPSDDYVRAVRAVPGSTDVIVTGTVRGNTMLGTTPIVRTGSDASLFIARVRTDGTVVWIYQPGRRGAMAHDVAVNGLAVGADGSVYAAGTACANLTYVVWAPGSETFTDGGNCTAFVISLNPSGTFRWLADYRAGGTEGWQNLALSPDGGRLVVGGYSDGGATLGTGVTINDLPNITYLVAGLSTTSATATHQFSWAVQASGVGYQLADQAAPLAITSSGTVFASGAAACVTPPCTTRILTVGGTSVTAGRTTFIAEISSSGTVVRLVGTGGATSPGDRISAMELSLDGTTLYVANQRTSEVELFDVNVTSGVASGTAILGSAAAPLRINRLAADVTGVVAGGAYRGSLGARFPGAPVSAIDTAFIARVRGTLTGRYFVGTSAAEVWSLSRDDLGGYIVGGEFSSALNFEGTRLPGNGSMNIFFGRTTL